MALYFCIQSVTCFPFALLPELSPPGQSSGAACRTERDFFSYVCNALRTPRQTEMAILFTFQETDTSKGNKKTPTFSISLSRGRFEPRPPAGTDECRSSLPRPEPISDP